MNDTIVRCRSVGPDGQPCMKRRGHKYSDWATSPWKLHANSGTPWRGGINTPATYITRDSGETSLADDMTWNRRGMLRG